MPSKTIKFGLALAAAGAGAYFLDPENGERRRAALRERLSGASTGEGSERVVQAAQNAASKVRDGAENLGADDQPGESAPNDQELAHKVETAIFRSPDVPKGSVNVNAEADIVYLRGQVESTEQIQQLVDAARAVEGVRGVENLLHLPQEPAKAKQETEDETRRRVKGKTE